VTHTALPERNRIELAMEYAPCAKGRLRKNAEMMMYVIALATMSADVDHWWRLASAMSRRKERESNLKRSHA